MSKAKTWSFRCITLRVASLGRVFDFLSLRCPDPFSLFVACCDDWLVFDDVFVLIMALESISIFRRMLRRNLSAISRLRYCMLRSSLRLAVCRRKLKTLFRAQRRIHLVTNL